LIPSKNLKIAVIGLGYVGLPLAVEFAKDRDVVGFDLDKERIKELKQGWDKTQELSAQEIQASHKLTMSSELTDLAHCNCFIITVPTPVNKNNEPDMSLVFSACKIIGEVISPDSIVILESTVYPGATEDECAPIIETVSGLTFCNKATPRNKRSKGIFHMGYSPERINPGDKSHNLPSIVKITSGSTAEAAEVVDELYGSIIVAGTFKAPSIRVAEAAKVIENTQRDINIALVNEFAKIFHLMDIDTRDVLEAAGTKWNFLPFKPGLVGGHCIGVDPYYLTHQAKKIGHDPELILAGRKMNDSMGIYSAERVKELMLENKMDLSKARILIFGVTFKANCPDTRNSKVYDLITELETYGCQLSLNDPFLTAKDLPTTLQEKFVARPKAGYYDTIILAVAHQDYIELGVSKLRSFGIQGHLFFDLQAIFPKETTDGRL
jgi:UDP-N-acetyl-D-galactosamine dehydrogenase